MALQNFRARTLPTISAAWLNAVDVLKSTVFGDATTAAAAQTALFSGAPLAASNGGTGSVGSGAPFLTFLASFFPSLYVYVNPRTAAEIAVSVTPSDYSYPQGHAYRYGVVQNGATDDTAALIRWASVKGNLYLPSGDCLISDEITLYTGSSFVGNGNSTIIQHTANKAVFRATSKSEISITGIHFRQAASAIGGSAYIAGVVLDRCANCTVYDNEFEGFQWCGVYVLASNYCTVRGNYIHDFYNGQAITFLAAVNAGATSATLNANWTLASGVYTVGFVETAGGAVEGRAVTFANGAATASFAAITNNCNAAANVNCISDSSDIAIHSSATTPANYNVVTENFCFGNCAVGVNLQDPYSGVLPVKNLIAFNQIGAHMSYGIINYMPDAGDSYSRIIGNYIEGITGSYALNQSAGAGIYSVGAGTGGLIIAHNEIVNCCISTANTTLAPGGIGVAGTSAGTAPVSIVNNSIDGMTQYHGIIATGLLGGGSIGNNTIRQPAANITGHGLYIVNGDGLTVIGNKVTQLNTTTSQRGILFIAITLDCTNHNCIGNNVTGGHFSQLETSSSGGGVVRGCTFTGNNLNGSDGTANPITLASGSADLCTFTGNHIYNGSNYPIKQTSCTSIRYSANIIRGAAGASVTFIGTNTGGFLDRSNTGLVFAGVNNAGTGMTIEMVSTAVPATGVWAKGDTIYRSDPAAAGIYLWVCTTAGTGGGTAVFNTISNT